MFCKFCGAALCPPPGAIHIRCACGRTIPLAGHNGGQAVFRPVQPPAEARPAIPERPAAPTPAGPAAAMPYRPAPRPDNSPNWFGSQAQAQPPAPARPASSPVPPPVPAPVRREAPAFAPGPAPVLSSPGIQEIGAGAFFPSAPSLGGVIGYAAPAARGPVPTLHGWMDPPAAEDSVFSAPAPNEGAPVNPVRGWNAPPAPFPIPDPQEEP